jgi:hypothetical protein
MGWPLLLLTRGETMNPVWAYGREREGYAMTLHKVPRAGGRTFDIGVETAHGRVPSRRLRLEATVFATVVTVFVSMLAIVLPATPASAYGEPCAPVMFYFSRGSGEGDGIGGPGDALLQALKTSTNATIQEAANPYPAVKVASPRDFYNAIIASTAYQDSVEAGAQFLAHDITDLATRCSTSTLIVGGYSAGAEATRYGLSRISAAVQSHIKAVAMFGDPWFLSTEGNVIAAGGFDRTLKGIHYAKNYAGVPNSYPLLPKALPAVFKGRAVSFCRSGDTVCNYSAGNAAANIANNFVVHRSYAGDADAMARAITPMLPLAGGGGTGGTTGGTASICETFVSDVTIPDGSVFQPGQGFTKTWRLHNCGASRWPTTMGAVRVSGTFGPASFTVPSAAAGASVNVSAAMTAPTAAGHYMATYKLRSSTGALGNNVFWVDINVAAAAHDCEAFVADVTIPDGTLVTAAQTVSKTWRLRNCGTSNWAGLTAVRTGGTYGPASFAVPTVPPGGTVNLTVPVTAPVTDGLARATYRLQAADGHYADNSFWVELSVSGTPLPPPPNRQAITSYDQMRGGAPYHGYFATSWQPFTAASNTITYLSATVGTPGGAAGAATGVGLLLRLCTDPNCAGILAQASPQIINYGETGADIGDVTVTPGATYYIVWYQPVTLNGQTWVTYWWSGGPTIGSSDLMQGVVRGYNR